MSSFLLSHVPLDCSMIDSYRNPARPIIVSRSNISLVRACMYQARFLLHEEESQDNALKNFTKIEPNMFFFFVTEHVWVNLNTFRLISGDHDTAVHWPAGSPFKIRINSHIYRSYWYWEVFINLGRLGYVKGLYIFRSYQFYAD